MCVWLWLSARRRRWVAVFGVALACPLTYSDCLFDVEAAYGLPSGLLSAVAVVEGAGEGYAHRNANGTVDMGLMQVNTVHWPRIDDLLDGRASPWHAIYSRCYSAALGGWVLAHKLRDAGDLPTPDDFWLSVGAYYSNGPERRREYGERVRDVWESMLSR